MKGLPFRVTPLMVFVVLLILSVPNMCLMLISAIPPRTTPYRELCLESRIDLTLEKPPAGTVALEPLIKLDASDENFTPFNLPEFTNSSGSPYTEITPDCELAEYNDDGYVSFSLHWENVENMYYQRDELSNTSINDIYLHIHLPRDGADFGDIYERYGAFRAAYVGENGEILGVISESERRYKAPGYTLELENGELVFCSMRLSPLWRALMLLSVAALLTSAVGIVVCVTVNIVRKIRRRKELKGVPK